MDRAKADAERARLLDDLLDVLADPAIPDDHAGRIAYACNLGYAGMADASGISEDQLAWTAQLYLRQDNPAGGGHPPGQRPPRASTR